MLDCIVIGAGPGGLVCTKELLEQGLSNILCLEQAEDVGGVFGNTYDNLVLTSSTMLSMFSDFWVGDGNQQTFWTKKEAVDYWKKYARHFNVFDRIRFNSKVTSVTPQEGEGWEVSLASGETFLSKRVALAIGNNAVPNYPAWKNSLTEVKYSHSKEYRNANEFVGKNVLVVGGGESGSDVALQVSRVANKCWISLRSSTGWVAARRRAGKILPDNLLNRILWGIPRNYGPTLTKIEGFLSKRVFNEPINLTAVKLNEKVKAQNGIFGTYGTKTYSLPRAIVNHDCKVVGEITKVEDGGRTLQTTEGEMLQNVDAVVFSTGYKNYVSFLPEELRQTDPRSLYKHMFHPKYQDKIVWIGWARPNFGSQFPVMEMQARLFSLVCTGEKILPTPAEMEKVICLDRATWLEQFEHNAHRIRSLVDYRRYMDNLASLIGCQPPLWKYLFLHPRLWRRMVFGATQAIQYRLRGPGSKKSVAHEWLMKIPVGIPGPVIKDVLQKRLIDDSLNTRLLPQTPENIERIITHTVSR